MLSSASKRISTLTSQILQSRNASTMKEAIVHKGPKVQIINSPMPKPGKGQVVTKVIYSGSNPKDWKVPGITTFKHGCPN